LSQVLRGIGGLLSKNVGVPNLRDVSSANLSASAFIAAGEVSGHLPDSRRSIRLTKPATL